ncbi:MAG TPA: ATP-binding protein [Longimicrobium sp.]
MRTQSRREGAVWIAAAVGATLALLQYPGSFGEAPVALTYLLVVLGASARGGRRLGLVLALLCFFAFNFFFLEPRYTLAIRSRSDWLVLLAFVVASAVATMLLARAQSEAAAARERASEIDRLATLGAEALNAGRAEDAVGAIARVVRSGLGVAVCEIFLGDGEGRRVQRVARATEGGTETRPVSWDGGAPGDTAGWGADGSMTETQLMVSGDARSLLIPLRVRERSVGVLRLESVRAIHLDAAQTRFTEALAYYAALAIDRVRLAAAQEHAEALREADRLKDALLASVSHDLRTPLTTIKALSQAIADEGDERALVVVEEADRLNRFVSDLLDFSRLNGGAPVLRAELVAAEDVIGAALQQVSGTYPDRPIDASLDPAHDLLVGRFDFDHTLRALVNLIDNALKYSPPGAPVRVVAAREGDRVAFSVADRGAGIAPEDGARIFEPFYRARGTADAGGTGLGLSIAQRAVELQGGELRYAPRPGGGSEFVILLPAVDPAELAAM